MVYVLIAVYNRIQTTLECLACFDAQTDKNFRVVIVDDGSTDGTEEKLRARYPNITILKGDGNLWWTGAMALGVEHILKTASDTDYILSINNDVVFDSDYVEQLIRTSTQHNNAIVGSLCKDIVDRNIVCDSGIRMNWKKYQYRQVPYDASLDAVTTVDTISGRGVLIPTQVFKKIGNFLKNRLPHYGSDYEFGFRAKRAGVPLVVSYRAIVYLHNEMTGFRPEGRVLSYADYWKQLWNIKSPSNLPVHIKLIAMHCPGTALKTSVLAYYIAGNIYGLLRNTAYYTAIKCGLIKNNHATT